MEEESLDTHQREIEKLWKALMLEQDEEKK